MQFLISLQGPKSPLRYCPNLGKLSAMIADEQRPTYDKIRDDEKAVEQLADIAHLANLELGASIAKEPALKQVAKKKPDLAKMGRVLNKVAIVKDPQKRKKGSMFVDTTLNGQNVRIMVDTGATHNFVSKEKAK